MKKKLYPPLYLSRLRQNNALLLMCVILMPAILILIFSPSPSFGLSSPHRVTKYGDRKKSKILPLKPLIKDALKNPAISSSMLKAAGSKEEIIIAKTLPEPIVGFGLTDADGFNNPGIGVNSMSNIGFSASQMIPFPSKLETKSRIEKYSYLSLSEKTRALKIDAAYAVKKSYYSLALIEKQISVVKYNRLLLKIILNDISRQYGVGRANAPAYIRTMLENASLKSELFSLNRAKSETIYLLSELTGLRPAYIKNLHAAMPKIPEAKSDEALKSNKKEEIKNAFKFNPELRRLEYLSKKSSQESAYAKESYLPDFYLKLGYGDRYSMVPVLSGSVGLSLPIYFNGYQKPLINKAEKDKLSSIYNVSWEKLRIIKGVRTDIKNMRIDESNYRLYRTLYVPEARLLLKAELSSFGVKRTSAFSLLDSFRKLINSELEMDIYNTKYYIDKSGLEKVVGKIR